MEIKEGDTVEHSSRPNTRLYVASVLNGKAACKSHGEKFGKEYPVDELKFISRQPGGPMTLTFG